MSQILPDCPKKRQRAKRCPVFQQQHLSPHDPNPYVYITAPLCAGLAGGGDLIFSNLVVGFLGSARGGSLVEDGQGIPITRRSLGEVRAQAEPGNEENETCIKQGPRVSRLRRVHRSEHMYT